MSRAPAKRYGHAQAATTLSLLAVLSPAVGLFVEIMLAWRFGSSSTVDAYRACVQILTLGSTLFFGQLLPNVVVPIFIEYRAQNRERQGWAMAFSLGQLMTLCMLPLVLWVWLRPDHVVHLLAPGLTGVGHQQADVMARYFVLAFVAMVWSGIMSGILYAHDTFWVFPIGQVANNCLLILALSVLSRFWSGNVLVVGVLFGAVSMFLIHGIFLYRLARPAGIRWNDFFQLGPMEGLKKALRISLPIIGMIAVGQWADIVTQRTLSRLPVGTLSTFGYSFKLLLLVGILPTSLATVVFPSLSDAQARNDWNTWSRLASRAIRMTLFLSVSLCAIFFSLRVPLITLILQRGAMDASALQGVQHLFAFLLIGAPASALMVLLYKFSFAMQDTHVPAVIVVLSTLLTLLLIPWAGSRAGAAGVAMGYSVVVWICVVVLMAHQNRQHRILLKGGNFAFLLKLIALLVIVFAAGALGNRCCAGLPTFSKLFLIAHLAVVGLFSFSGVYAFSRLLHMEELREVQEYATWQVRKLFSMARPS